jgi:hypothetical protein
LRERKEARIRRQQSSSSGPGDDDEGDHALAKSPWTLAKEEAKSAPPVRCTGEAIQCAIDLATAGSTNTARTSRILLFTDGCPNYGDGSVVSSEAASTAPGRGRAVLNVDPHTLSRAVQYFDIIARSASEAGVAIDVFCTGALELGLPSYQALVLPSAGYVLPHVTFATPHLKNNLGFVLKHKFVSTAPMNESKMIVVAVVDGGLERVYYRCENVEVRLKSLCGLPISITNLVISRYRFCSLTTSYARTRSAVFSLPQRSSVQVSS